MTYETLAIYAQQATNGNVTVQRITRSKVIVIFSAKRLNINKLNNLIRLCEARQAYHIRLIDGKLAIEMHLMSGSRLTEARSIRKSFNRMEKEMGLTPERNPRRIRQVIQTEYEDNLEQAINKIKDFEIPDLDPSMLEIPDLQFEIPEIPDPDKK